MRLRQLATAITTLSLLTPTTFARPSPQDEALPARSLMDEPFPAKRSFPEELTPTSEPPSISRVINDPRSPPNFSGAGKTKIKPHVDTKYFHEPGGSEALNHMDIRYFTAVSDEEKSATLHYMVRAYLTTFRRLGIETWIAHGTLLGWWWNGKIMPWDWDLDTQVAASTLVYLGEHWNMTRHEWNDTSFSGDGTPVTRTYLLDINPNSKERVRGDGGNVIDARWIDVSNGLFIDITGLSETRPDEQPGVWSCKNYHRYQTKELYPMRETTFEGVPASVPYSYERILVAEYQNRALTKTHHEGHTWDPDKKEWIKDAYEPQKPFRRNAARGVTPEMEELERRLESLGRARGLKG